MIRIRELAGMDLEAVLFGGQTFRWERVEVGWTAGWIGDRPVRVRVTQEGLEVEPRTAQDDGLEPAARRYFDADRDYAGIRERLLRDDRLRVAAAGLDGLRILRQPPFETVISFIVSANNNIPRITKCLSSLCRLGGNPVSIDGEIEWSFPGPESLAGLDAATLRAEANLGYRDRYVAETSALVATGAARLGDWEAERTPALLANLRSLPGVGPKVAECIALFAYGRFDVFPVDTWIRQVYSQTYPSRGPVATNRQIRERARRRFGSGAGLAQQYLFEFVRRRGRAAVNQT
ncbi:MAG: hypothetical protein IPF82_03540 [Blastocatellia bacterium]|nr:hypothetical protein [Blastocatellia bacterium]